MRRLWATLHCHMHLWNKINTAQKTALVRVLNVISHLFAVKGWTSSVMTNFLVKTVWIVVARLCFWLGTFQVVDLTKMVSTSSHSSWISRLELKINFTLKFIYLLPLSNLTIKLQFLSEIDGCSLRNRQVRWIFEGFSCPFV